MLNHGANSPFLPAPASVESVFVSHEIILAFGSGVSDELSEFCGVGVSASISKTHNAKHKSSDSKELNRLLRRIVTDVKNPFRR